MSRKENCSLGIHKWVSTSWYDRCELCGKTRELRALGIKGKIVLCSFYVMLIVVAAVIFGYYLYREEIKPQRDAWKQAKQENTIESYLHYLNEYPKKHLTEIRYSLHNLLYSQRGVNTNIYQSYGSAKKVSFPFMETVAKFTLALDIRDVRIDIKSIGEPIKRNYTHRGYLYTGATLSGSFSIYDDKTNKVLKETKFSWKKEPVYSFTLRETQSGPKSPDDAPFWGLYNNWAFIFAEALGEIFGVEVLVSAMEYNDPEISFYAAWSLAKLYGDARALDTLISYAKNVKPMYHSGKTSGLLYHSKEIGEAMGQIGEPAVKILVIALNDQSWDLGGQAAKALGIIKDPNSIEPLISALNEGHFYVKWNAAWALGEIGDVRAIESLILALNRKNYSSSGDYVRDNASEALIKITGQDFGKDSKEWQSWWELNKDEYLRNKT